MKVIEVDKIGSSVSPLNLTKTVSITDSCAEPKIGDVVVVKALSESLTYGNLELPSGRLAKINKGDILLGVLGKRRALKGFVGDIPESIKSGDRLHLLNMGGVIGVCKGRHSSLSDAIEVEVLGIACEDLREAVAPALAGASAVKENYALPKPSRATASRKTAPHILNIADRALPPSNFLKRSAPLVVVAGTCMNSGKTVAVTEIIKQASHAGLRVAGGKLSGVACLRDTLNMEDHGAIATASFLDCGLPSTVETRDLASVAKAILNKLNESDPDLIVVELGDGILGGYAVDSILEDAQIRAATASFIFCANDYLGAWGGIEILKKHGIAVDIIAGSVTDSQMGEDYVRTEFGIDAGNAPRDGLQLFKMIGDKISSLNSTIKLAA